jgi:hypothetical protein
VVERFVTAQGVQVPIALHSLAGITAGRDDFFGAHTCAWKANGQPFCWGGNSFGQTSVVGGADQLRPVLVPSFTANVEVASTLRPNGRTVSVVGLINCSPGAFASISISLTQGAASGTGVANERCTGGLVQVPIHVAAHGPERFQEGTAVANLEAEIRDNGDIIEQQVWTRQITLTVQ